MQAIFYEKDYPLLIPTNLDQSREDRRELKANKFLKGLTCYGTGAGY